MASTNSPCAACKFLRRKCTPECMFAPYFPADQPQKFANVHKVFGASNVQKLLAELPVDHREDAVNSLAYEAETRLRDPVYGCVGLISILQQRLKILQNELQSAHKELALYQGLVMQTQQTMGVAGFSIAPPAPGAMHPLGVNPSSSSASGVQNKMTQIMGIPTTGGPLVIREPSQQSNNNNAQQLFNPEQLITDAAAATREQQEIIRALEVQQQNGQDVRFDGGQGFDVRAGNSEAIGVIGFGSNTPPPTVVSPSPFLGTFEWGFSNHHFHHQVSLHPQQVVAVEEHHMHKQDPQEQPEESNRNGEDVGHTTSR